MRLKCAARSKHTGFELVTARVVANCVTFAPHSQRLVWATLHEKRRRRHLNLSGNDCIMLCNQRWLEVCMSNEKVQLF
jgi:hypothetical protein